MGVKKDIGKVLNEKLKNIQLSPDEKVWGRIQGSLNTQKRNRIISFWSKSFGIGLLIISLSAIIYNSLDSKNSNSEILKTKNTSSPSELNKIQENIKDNIVDIDGNLLNNQSEINLTNQNESITSKKNSSKDKLTSEKKITDNFNYENINTSNQNEITNNADDRRKINNSKNGSNTSATKTLRNKNYTNIAANDNNLDERALSQSKKIILKNTTLRNKNKKTPSKSLNSLKDISKESLIISLDSIISKDSLLLKVALQDSIPSKKDSKNKVIPKKESFWDVSFYVIPTYYNTLSEGSTFGDNFINHKREGGITLSYRITFDIKLSEKINLRTGFGKVNLSHTTLNVATTTSTGTIPNLTEFDGISYDFIALDNIYSNELLGTSSNLNFEQKFGYFEIPAELVYNFPSKKVKWKIIGGASVLKITDNSIIAESSNGNYTIGKSNNLSEYSFSANLGGGLDYPLSKRLKINVEPMLKYHMKTFSRKTASFKPYSLSISIGATYKF